MAKAARSKAVSSSAAGTGKSPAPKKEVSKAKAPAAKKEAVPVAPKKPAAPPVKAGAKKVPAAGRKPSPGTPKAPATLPAGKEKTAPPKAVPPAKKPVAKAAPKTAVKSPPKAGAKPVAKKREASKAAAKKPLSTAAIKAPEVPVPSPKDLGKPMEPYRARRVLITLPQPEGDKSPYFDLAKKQGLTIDFFPFISVEGLTGKEFRQQKVDFNQFTAVVFTSRLAVDHFFRIMEEVRIKVSQDLKYFCITEAVALYLQKFIMYRKRKVFFSADGSTQGLLDVIGRHRSEKYMVSTADGVKKEIPLFLRKYKITFAEAALYRTVSNNISPAMAETRYDMILFFSPHSVQALFEQAPDYHQRDTVMGAFGPSTARAVEEAGLRLDIKAPAPQMPSMVAALEHFFEGK